MPSPFDDDTAARELLERLRWPDGPACPRCDARGPDVFKIGGEKHSHRDGLYQCKPRRHQFTVTVGTALERQRIPLSTWVRAAHEFSYEGPAYGKGKDRKLKPPPLTELQPRIGVSYPTVLHIRDVIEYAARRYRGHKTGFGAWPRSFMKGAGTWLPDYDPRKRKRLAEGKDPSQHTIMAAHILADVMSEYKTADTPAAFDRTEVLLRLLLATPPKARSAQAPENAALWC
ncbi:transposase [Bradyrhizobium erythrophlei]|uniref:Transposase zinc-ribbon domain-containing protein n=1 Tax=Bradyrhizobium erythrophlei TaxID=1437360 RepID=A0A1M5NBM0_9BRAD|nr:transposase [Bradyrhizobium erythrophlei]SHG86891.1 Transposase zinc-ribbon domain-containing protein [Bradyrhizobium erythrophlei]